MKNKSLILLSLVSLGLPARLVTESKYEPPVFPDLDKDEPKEPLAVLATPPVFSIVRDNLMNEKGYKPYCGRAGRCSGYWPRTVFTGSQFRCESCGWQSNFEPEFIANYKAKVLIGNYERDYGRKI